MPTNKDFKRLVRRRMHKTGESYTSARAQLLEMGSSKTQRTTAPVDYAKLAGMSDTALKAKTDCTWERWVKALDRVEAYTWPHREIAKHVHDTPLILVGKMWADLVDWARTHLRDSRLPLANVVERSSGIM